MKKIQFSIIGLIAIMLFSCNPNKKIYDELDAMRVPYNEQFTYELTDQDYTVIKSLAMANAENGDDSAMAGDIATFMSFNDNRKVALFVPDFLESSFIALDSASAITIRYNYDDQFFFAADRIISVEDTVIYGDPNNYSSIIETQIQDAEEDDFAVAEYYAMTIPFADTVYEKTYSLYQFVMNDNDELEWEEQENTYTVMKADYDAMGTAYGQPGYYNNFSSDAQPSKYLEQLLVANFPYATSGDFAQVIYKYYSGGNQISYNKCYFNGVNWEINQIKSDQFIHTGDKWAFDPTVSYYLEKVDYQFLVDWITTNDTLSGYLDDGHPENTEQYFGASSYYGNFDLRQTARLGNDPNGYLADLNEEEIDEILYNRLILAVELILPYKYPTAQAFSNGVPVYYEITFDVYNGKHIDYMVKFLCTDVGKFEYVDGPTEVQ